MRSRWPCLGAFLLLLAQGAPRLEGADGGPDREAPPTSVCAGCHPRVTSRFPRTPHGPSFGGTDSDAACAPCHGKARRHVTEWRWDGGIRVPLDDVREHQRDREARDARCDTCHPDPLDLHEPEVRRRMEEEPEGCLGCHRIHVEPAAPAPRPLASPPPVRVHPPVETSLARGLVEVGFREVWVDGDEATFDSDVNLDRGFRVLRLLVEGEIPDAAFPVRAYRLSATGIDDPNQVYSFRIEGRAAWRLDGSWQATNYVFKAPTEFQPVPPPEVDDVASFEQDLTSELHHYDMKRDLASLRLVVGESEGSHLFVEYARRRRDGEIASTRYIIGSVFVPEANEFSHRVDGVEAGGQLQHGDWIFRASQSYSEFRRRDRRVLDQSLSQGQFDAMEDFTSRTETKAARSTVSVRYDPESPWFLELDGSYRYADEDVRTESIRSELLADDSETLSADADIEHETGKVRLRGGVELTDEVELAAHYRFEGFETDSALTRETLTQSPPFSGTGATVTALFATPLEGRTHVAGVEILGRPAAFVTLRGGLDYVTAHYRNTLGQFDLTTGQFTSIRHDSDTVAPFAAGTAKMGDLEAQALFQYQDQDEPFTAVSPSRRQLLRLKLLWKPSELVRVGVQHERREGEHGSYSSRYRSVTVSGGTTLFGGNLSVDALLTYKDAGSRIDVRFVNAQAVPPPNVQSFSSDEIHAELQAHCRMLPELLLELSGLYVRNFEDFSYEYYQIGPSILWQVQEHVGVRGEWRLYRFADHSFSDANYRAHLLQLSTILGF